MQLVMLGLWVISRLEAAHVLNNDRVLESSRTRS